MKLTNSITKALAVMLMLTMGVLKISAQNPWQVGTTTYANWADAQNAAQAGDTIRLMQDLSLTDSCSVTKNVVIDLNGHILSAGVTDRFQAFRLSSSCTMVDGNPTATHAAPYDTIPGAIIANFKGNQPQGVQSYDDGGAISFNKGYHTLTLKGIAFVGNEATNSGGAIGTLYSAALVVDGTKFINNSTLTGMGGAISINELTATNAKFYGNTSSNDAGAVNIMSLNNVQVANSINKCVFINNTASLCGGALCFNRGSLTIDSCTFTSNSAAVGGGAICLKVNDATLTNAVTITHTTIKNNAVTGEGYHYRGGGIYVDDQNAVNNTLTLGDGTVIENNTSLTSFPSGGVSACADENYKCSVQLTGKVIIRNNTSKDGIDANLTLTDGRSSITSIGLTTGSEIGVSKINEQSSPSYASGAISDVNVGTTGDLTYFTSDNATQYVRFNQTHNNIELTADYTLYLAKGKVYKNSSSGEDITTEMAAKGLTYDISTDPTTWTMNNFEFSTTAEVGVIVSQKLQIKVEGTSSITSGDAETGDAVGIRFDVTDSKIVLDNGAALTVNGGDSESGNAYGISATGNLTVESSGTQMGTLNVSSGNSSNGNAEGLVTTGTLTVDSCNIVATAGTASSNSVGLDVNNLRLKNSASIECITSTATTQVGSKSNSRLPGATIKTDTGGSVYMKKNGGYYYSYLDQAGTQYASHIVLTPNTNLLHFVSLKNGGSVRLNKVGEMAEFMLFASVQYSTDNQVTWADYSFGTSIPLNQNDTVWFRAGGANNTNSEFSSEDFGYYQFAFGANDNIAAGGSIMSLLDATLAKDEVPAYAFINLFANCTALVSAPELPAQTMGANCYDAMFQNCSNLKEVHDMNITTLANNCFQNMFNGCSELYVDTITGSCTGAEFDFDATAATGWNSNMFTGCLGPKAGSITAGGHYCISEYVEIKEFEYTLSQNVDVTYSGMAKSVSVTVTDPATGATVQYSTDKGNTWTAGSSVSRMNAGVDSVQFKISATGYTDTITAPVVIRIQQAQIADSMIANIPTQVHTGDSIKPGLNITLGSYSLVAGTDYTVSYINNVEIGTATANVTGVGNFTGTASKEFTIVPDTFDITVNVNDTAMGSATGTDRYVEYTTATLTATANEHYHFTGWDNGRTDNPYTVYVEKDSTITAQFALDSFKLNVVAGEPDWGGVYGTGEYEYGAVRTISAQAANHFHFVKWSNGVTDANTTVNLTSDSTIVAIFAMDRNTVTLTVNNPALGTVEGAGEYDYYDNTITVIAVPANNHVRFDGWYSDNQFVVGLDTLYHIMIMNDINLEARFYLDQHVVTATAGEGGSVTGGNTYNHGATATLVATPVAHYHFVNWSNGSVNDTLSFVVDTTYSFTANFAIDEHVVRTNVNNTAAGSVTGAGTYNYGDTATLTAIPAAHYEFVQWSNGLTDTTINVILAGDTTLTATFARDEHIITVNNNNPTMGNVSGGSVYTHGDMATITATANEHYHFVNWSNGVTSTTFGILVEKDSTVAANFAIDRHNVNVLRNNNAYGTVTGAGEYDYGAIVPLTATANQYYHFTGWSNGVQTATMTITLAGDTTVTANFAVDTFDIVTNLNVDSMGTVTGAGRYTYGQMVTLTATPAADHHFVNWSNGETRNSFSFMPDSNVTLTAIFAINEQQVTVSSIDDALGTVAGSGTYNWGTNVTVTATPADHYHFTGWSDGSMANPYRFKVISDTTLVASFAIDTFTVTVAANYDSLGTVTGAGRYTYGSVATLTATPAEHYHVAGWSNGMTGDSINVVVTSDSDLVAYFEIDTFFVTGNVIGVGQIENLGVYNDGDTVTLIASQTADNYTFAGWTGDTTGIEMFTDLSSDIITFVVTRDVEFTATFVYVPTSVDETESVEYVAFSEGMNVVVNGVENRMVAVYDMTGKLVKIVKSAQDVERISVHAAGIYLVRVDNKKTLRVVVK